MEIQLYVQLFVITLNITLLHYFLDNTSLHKYYITVRYITLATRMESNSFAPVCGVSGLTMQ